MKSETSRISHEQQGMKEKIKVCVSLNYTMVQVLR